MVRSRTTLLSRSRLLLQTFLSPPVRLVLPFPRLLPFLLRSYSECYCETSNADVNSLIVPSYVLCNSGGRSRCSCSSIASGHPETRVCTPSQETTRWFPDPWSCTWQVFALVCDAPVDY